MDYLLENFDMPKGIKWLKGLGEDLPFENNFFDLIISTNTLDHTKNPEKILAEISRTLKNQGILFLTVDTHPLWAKLIKMFLERIDQGDPHHPHTFTRHEIEAILDRFGFKTIKTSDEKDDLGIVIEKKKAERIPLKLRNKFPSALAIKKKQGYRGLLKAFLGSVFLHLFQASRLFPKKYSIFIASK